MSAREVRALGTAPVSPPKRGRKRGQSNTEATTAKRTKPTTKSDDEGSVEVEPDAGKKGKGKAGGKKGKKARMTGAQRAARDKVENDKGVPASLTPVERALDAAHTSVAPPKRTGRSSASSFLPPAPTVASSRSRINREPEVIVASKESSDEESDEEGDEEEGSDGDNRDIDHTASRAMSTSRDRLVEDIYLSKPTTRREPSVNDIDLSHLAPPERPEPANGSSRSTGGILRGRALGNSFNIGDPIDNVPQDVTPLANGRINVTIVQQPPTDLVIENPTSHLNVKSPCYDTLGPLLKKVAKSYSPVRKHNYRVYVLDRNQWSIMGRYNVVVEDDENVVWEEDETGKFTTHILLENDREQIVASAIPPSFHQRSVSLGSRSESVPRSLSVSSESSRGPSLAPSLDTSEGTGPSKLSKENKDHLLEYLGIDTELPSLGPSGLRSAYQKFKAITDATPK
ncbi:hypothetical protein M413DRAFT_30115, partial [Hebeloma cylindrosporum]